MSKVSYSISDLDRLIDSLYTGDNVVWEVDAGTSYDIFIKNFIIYIKALKLTDRHNRVAFKPHLYEIADKDIVITLPKKEPVTDRGIKQAFFYRSDTLVYTCHKGRPFDNF